MKLLNAWMALILLFTPACNNSKNQRLGIAGTSTPETISCPAIRATLNTVDAKKEFILPVTTAAHFTPVVQVLWKVSATGGCGNSAFRLSESEDSFREGEIAYFDKEYSSPGIKTETVIIHSVSSTGHTLQEQAFLTPPIEVKSVSQLPSGILGCSVSAFRGSKSVLTNPDGSLRSSVTFEFVLGSFRGSAAARTKILSIRDKQGKTVSFGNNPNPTAELIHNIEATVSNTGEYQLSFEVEELTSFERANCETAIAVIGNLPQPPTAQISADPPTVSYGSTSSIQWTCTHSTSGKVMSSTSNVVWEGINGFNVTQSLTTTTSYILNCTSPFYTDVTSQVTVNVLPPSTPPPGGTTDPPPPPPVCRTSPKTLFANPSPETFSVPCDGTISNIGMDDNLATLVTRGSQTWIAHICDDDYLNNINSKATVPVCSRISDNGGIVCDLDGTLLAKGDTSEKCPNLGSALVKVKAGDTIQFYRTGKGSVIYTPDQPQ